MTAIALAGYHLGETLYQGTRTFVYRGMRNRDGQPVILKVLRNPHPTFNDLVRFRNQYAIARHLDSSYIVQPLALERCGNGYALVMPDDGAIALPHDWQQRPRHCSEFLGEFLAIAMQLADALHDLGQHRIIHKDIKPHNILIHPKTRQVQLIDFSIASLLPKEQQQFANPGRLEGTLAYLSPEQTGRMNRGIDYRTDFYSLGVTLYELLTGERPFTSNDPMELIHCHIAKPLHFNLDNLDSLLGKRYATQLLQVLTKIVMKLMAKNAEDRYQSALGLKYDLGQCLQQLNEKDNVELFALGERDVCDRFLVPEKLYGRESEVRTLLESFNSIINLPNTKGQTPKAKMILVAGFSGIGKTAVVNEIHKPIVEQRGYFIKGKFDQFNRNIPFSAFVQAFRSLIGQLLSESDADLAHWQTKLLNALGDNGQIIIDVIPELERIIGPQPSVPELSGSAAQNRFNLLVRKFLRVFATQDHPLVIFLDDLQWIDAASLNLLQLLTNDSGTTHLLVVAAYRDNEVFPAHPLMLTLEEMQQQGTQLDTLTLSPLNEVAITRLVADTLLCSTIVATPLSQLIYQKTRGNPFFTIQFLQGLHEDSYITFAVDAGYWQCDLTAIRQLALTDDVVTFMVGRLRKLPTMTQEVLKLAACIGNRFDLATLGVVCDRSQEAVAQDLWWGLREGFVVPENETYKFFQGDRPQEIHFETMTIEYRFLHDRVQQAAYSLIPEEQKQITHLTIGQLLLHNTEAEQLEDNIFDIANQFNLGSQLIQHPAERQRLAELNAIAGEKAKTATAYTAADEYLEIARCLLAKDCWQTDYQFTLSFYEIATETAYLAGNFDKAERLIDRVLDRARFELDTAKIHEVRIQVLIAKNQPLDAIQTALKALGNLGICLPENPDAAEIDRSLNEIAEKIPLSRIQTLASLPMMVEKKQLAAMRLLSGFLNAAYLGRPNLLPLIVAQQVDLSITYGNMDVSPSAYANYGLILCGIANDINAGYLFGNLALNLLNKNDSKEFYAKTIEIVGLAVQHWQEHIASTLEPLLEAYKIGMESGDFESAAFAACDYCLHCFALGENLTDLEQKMLQYSTAISDAKQMMSAYVIDLHRQVILNLTEKSKTPSVLKGTAYDEEKMLHLLVVFHLHDHLLTPILDRYHL